MHVMEMLLILGSRKLNSHSYDLLTPLGANYSFVTCLKLSLLSQKHLRACVC